MTQLSDLPYDCLHKILGQVPWGPVLCTCKQLHAFLLAEAKRVKIPNIKQDVKRVAQLANGMPLLCELVIVPTNRDGSLSGVPTLRKTAPLVGKLRCPLFESLGTLDVSGTRLDAQDMALGFDMLIRHHPGLHTLILKDVLIHHVVWPMLARIPMPSLRHQDTMGIRMYANGSAVLFPKAEQAVELCHAPWFKQLHSFQFDSWEAPATEVYLCSLPTSLKHLTARVSSSPHKAPFQGKPIGMPPNLEELIVRGYDAELVACSLLTRPGQGLKLLKVEPMLLSARLEFMGSVTWGGFTGLHTLAIGPLCATDACIAGLRALVRLRQLSIAINVDQLLALTRLECWQSLTVLDLDLMPVYTIEDDRDYVPRIAAEVATHARLPAGLTRLSLNCSSLELIRSLLRSSHMADLASLKLSGGYVPHAAAGTAPTPLSLPSLRSLVLPCTRASQVLLCEFTSILPQLEAVQGCVDNPRLLQNLKRAEALSLSCPLLGGEVFQRDTLTWLHSLSRVRRLRLSDFELTAEELMGIAAALLQLVELDLADCSVSIEAISSVHWQSLETLVLDRKKRLLRGDWLVQPMLDIPLVDVYARPGCGRSRLLREGL